MLLRSALLASMTDSKKSVRNLVNDAILQLSGLLLPHKSISKEGANLEAATPEEVNFEEANLEEQLFDGLLDPPLFVGSLHIWELRDDKPSCNEAVEGDARAKNKEKATEQYEVDSSDDEGINYSTLLDNLSIPEDLF